MAGGVSEEEILKAFTACIETAPERVTVFLAGLFKMAQGLTNASAQGTAREAG